MIPLLWQLWRPPQNQRHGLTWVYFSFKPPPTFTFPKARNDVYNINLACVADSCKHPCTQSLQRLQFACSSFHENKKPFLIGYFGLVWYAPFDWPKIMITLQSCACNKNMPSVIWFRALMVGLTYWPGVWIFMLIIPFQFDLLQCMVGSPWEDHW